MHHAAPLTDDPVEERGLAHIGAADDGHGAQWQSNHLLEVNDMGSGTFGPEMN
jgi:hypothetical protein